MFSHLELGNVHEANIALICCHVLVRIYLHFVARQANLRVTEVTFLRIILAKK